MLAEKIINFEERVEKNKIMCNYKGVLYPVERETELSKIQIRRNGHTTTKRTHRFYIVVDRTKLYLDFDGNKVCNKQPGNSSTVDFLTVEEVELMKKVFMKYIKEANTPTNKLIAWKNYCLFYCGINVGLRASDLRKLQWKHLYDDNGDRKEGWWFKAKKTNKPTVIKFNNSFYSMIETYRKQLIEIKCTPHKEEYVFFSKKNDREPIVEGTMWKILNDMAEQAGIKKNIGSHTLRKTFGRNMYDHATDKEGMLVLLSEIFEHSSTRITRGYIGLTDEMKREAFDSIDGIFGDIMV